MRSAGRHTYNQAARSWKSTLAFWALAAFGLFELAKGASVLIAAMESTKWPSASACIIASGIHSVGSSESTSIEPGVTYTYTVDRVIHTGTGIAPGLEVQSANLAQEIASRFKEGSIHKAHYQPTHPETAYLEPGIQRGSLLNLLLGMVFFLFGSLPTMASCIIPKYGKLKPNGKMYTLASSHPAGRILDGAMLLLAASTLLLIYLCSSGYIVKP